MHAGRTLRGLAAAAAPAAMAATTAGGAAAAPLGATAGRGPVVYVAPDGDDAAAGTKDAPLRTIEAGRDALAGRTSEARPGTVEIRGGEYVLDDAVDLEGAAHSWVTYEAYEGEDVRVTGAHELPADGWQRLSDLTADELADPVLSSNARLDTPELRDGVWVYDLGAAGVDPGTLYKNGFNWLPQPFAPELVVDGETQTLAEYPNGDGCTGADDACYLYGNGAKWKVDGQGDLTQPDLVDRFGEENDWAASGTTPRAQFEDKKQQLDDPAQRDTWSQDEMRAMTPPLYEVGGRLLDGDRYQRWAPEAVPTIEDQGTRGFGEYSDVPVQADPAWIDDIDNTRYETEGWLSGYLGNNYANDMVRMLAWSGTTMYAKYPSMYWPRDDYTKVKAVNVLSELDAEGEYYVDRYDDNDVLYFKPAGDAVAGKQITLRAFDDNLFRLEGTTGVTIRGLSLSDSLVSGVQLLDAERTLIDDVEVSNVSMDAVRIGETTESITALPDYETIRGGHDNVVRNSYLHDLGGGGVLLGGGDRSTLERGDNVARNNEIARFSQLATYTPAGYLYGVGNSFEKNDVHDAPHMAVQIMGNDMRVNGNYFADLVTNAGDQGVVYTGRDYTYLGNEIAYNLFERIGGSNDAFYMDDGVSGMRFHHNVVKDAHSGVFFQSGHSNTATDNVFVDVDRTGHDQLYHRNGERGLPVANGWVVQSRFNAFLDVREAEKYSATPADVARWHAHYTDGKARYSDGTKILFPEIDDWYVPRVTATGVDCRAADYGVAEGCDRATVWEDPDSVYVPARNVLDRSVIIGGGEYEFGQGSFADPDATYRLDTWSDRINTNLSEPGSVEAAGRDLSTRKFSPRGEVARTLGRDWVATWNRLVTLDGVGRPGQDVREASTSR
ncbi:right-handed parallel beta-helix repeat-containing protein [Isoptericola sp. NPDC060257]|uniref:right-handed parallel beta-helix repeat-containing protein n=1 Tax=Isoptericola sp. NPDC060257 TaxID=3347087 RepID=UPI003645FB6B